MNNGNYHVLKSLLDAADDFKPLSISEKQKLSSAELKKYEIIEILSGWNYSKYSMLTLKKHHFSAPAANENY